MLGKTKMNIKRVIFMRHGNSLKNGDDYSDLTYEEFMAYLVREKNPPLEKIKGRRGITHLIHKLIIKPNGLWKYKLDSIPKNIEVIYTSPSRRSLETANKIRKKIHDKPKLDNSWKDLLAEVQFTKEILSKEEWETNGGWNGCRPLILTRWFNGENIESFTYSYKRVRKLDELIRKSTYKNILLLTHGFILRLISLYYDQKLKADPNGNLICNDETLQELLKAPRLKYGGYLDYELNRNANLVQNTFEEIEPFVLKKKIKKMNKQKTLLMSLFV